MVNFYGQQQSNAIHYQLNSKEVLVQVLSLSRKLITISRSSIVDCEAPAKSSGVHLVIISCEFGAPAVGRSDGKDGIRN
jgi:hypothetical protein